MGKTRDTGRKKITTANRRITYTNGDRVRIVNSIRKSISKGMSTTDACKVVGIQTNQYYRWKALIDKNTIIGEDGKRAINNTLSLSKRSNNVGKESQLKPIEDELINFIDEKREQGIVVNGPIVVAYASSLDCVFRAKTENAKLKAIHRFFDANRFVFRTGTHESQKSAEATKEDATVFISFSRPFVQGRHRDPKFIINMDQTPIPFTFQGKKTLERQGAKSVHMRKSTGDTKRATLAMSITARGDVLRPLLIFKGTRGGRIDKRELASYDDSYMSYAVQPKAWMDEYLMLFWVDNILAPYVGQCPPWVIPLLILDSYKVHLMKSVRDRIEGLGVELIFIPGGCTCHCQPVDVGINAPLKRRVKEQWIRWMIDLEINHATEVMPPTRALITEWVGNACKELCTGLVQNAWLDEAFTWFEGKQKNKY